MNFTAPVTLSGRHVSVVPLALAHHDDLVDAVSDGELWKLWYTSVPTVEKVRADIERRLALQDKGSAVEFAIVEAASGRAVGVTAYLNIEPASRRLEIGSTWYRKRVQRGPLNTECKLLLLTHAFESLKCLAVEFRTHFINRQSRTAIERLGAKLDGILRQHKIMEDGTLRDTCVYSIIDSEWPTVKSHLRFQLDKTRD
jgi:RimJ/RimL family protein N-acetyltransferase